MKGERTTKRLGVETNKSIKRNPNHGSRWGSDWKAEQFMIEATQKALYGSDGDERLVSSNKKQPLCELCQKAKKAAKNAHIDQMKIEIERKRKMQGPQIKKKTSKNDPPELSVEEQILSTFKFTRDKNCQSCLLMREQVFEKDVKFELLDRNENKRLARKGKKVPKKDTVDSSDSEIDDKQEEVKKF